jgi:hypothetical protein
LSSGSAIGTRLGFGRVRKQKPQIVLQARSRRWASAHAAPVFWIQDLLRLDHEQVVPFIPCLQKGGVHGHSSPDLLAPPVNRYPGDDEEGGNQARNASPIYYCSVIHDGTVISRNDNPRQASAPGNWHQGGLRVGKTHQL